MIGAAAGLSRRSWIRRRSWALAATTMVDLYWGTANETWGADVMLLDEVTGEMLNTGSLETDVPSDCKDPGRVAGSIANATRAWLRTLDGGAG